MLVSGELLTSGALVRCESPCAARGPNAPGRARVGHVRCGAAAVGLGAPCVCTMQVTVAVFHVDPSVFRVPRTGRPCGCCSWPGCPCRCPGGFFDPCLVFSLGRTAGQSSRYRDQLCRHVGRHPVTPVLTPFDYERRPNRYRTEHAGDPGKIRRMPNARQQASRRRGQQGKSRAGKPDAPRAQRSESGVLQQRAQRSLIEKISLYSGIVAAIVAIVAALFAVLTYVNQRDTNQAASTTTLEQYASKVSYVLETRGKNQELVITNRSIGAISSLEMIFPEPVQGCRPPSCTWVGFFYASLPNIPACDVLTSSVLGVFIKPKISTKAMNGSHLVFTDQNGNIWALYGGENNKLVQLAGNEVPAGVVTIPSGGLTPANGCS